MLATVRKLTKTLLICAMGIRLTLQEEESILDSAQVVAVYKSDSSDESLLIKNSYKAETRIEKSATDD